MTDALERLLREAGVPCLVEARDRLAIITPSQARHIMPATRARIIELAIAAGFTHVAVEIVPLDAALPGD